MLNYEFPPLGGGAGNANYHILKKFTSEPKLHIDLITSSVDTYKKEIFSKNIIIHYLDIGKTGNIHYQTNKELLTFFWKSIRYSKKLLKEKDFKIIHAFFGIPCGYIAMKLKLPYIVSLRGSDVPFYNPRFKLLDKLFFQKLSKKIWTKAEAVIANSTGLRDLALKTLPNIKIDIIPNGIDINTFKPDNKKQKIYSTIKLISTGRLIKRKGYDFLIRSLRDINFVELTLLGDGNLREELSKLAKENNVDVRILGSKDKKDVIKYLQNSDIFILPSLNEGMSNSILEAMACGLPIITTDVGGTKELINKNGYIIKKETLEPIKEILYKYRQNKSLLMAHGKESRKISKKFKWKNVAIGYYNIYDNLANKRKN
jgi:glycosyltransferase involved in cell wall biosynthesis